MSQLVTTDEIVDVNSKYTKAADESEVPSGAPCEWRTPKKSLTNKISTNVAPNAHVAVDYCYIDQ